MKNSNENIDVTFAFLDEDAKKEIRRSILKAVAIPGYIVPFASREMPVARGWGTGGMQITLSIINEKDNLKVIDQGCDGSVNAVLLRNFITSVSDVETTMDTTEASIIQTRHRVPEEDTDEGQTVVFQVPMPDVLVNVEPDTYQQKLLHAHNDYSKLWVLLYEDISMLGDSRFSHRYPVTVNDHYVMDPSPIPRYDIPKLNDNKSLLIFGAGREKKIYAIPPYTEVVPLQFDDVEFTYERFEGQKCSRCGSEDVYFDLVEQNGKEHYYCSDTAFCDKQLAAGGE